MSLGFRILFFLFPVVFHVGWVWVLGAYQTRGVEIRNSRRPETRWDDGLHCVCCLYYVLKISCFIILLPLLSCWPSIWNNKNRNECVANFESTYTFVHLNKIKFCDKVLPLLNPIIILPSIVSIFNQSTKMSICQHQIHAHTLTDKTKSAGNRLSWNPNLYLNLSTINEWRKIHIIWDNWKERCHLFILQKCNESTFHKVNP